MIVRPSALVDGRWSKKKIVSARNQPKTRFHAPREAGWWEHHQPSLFPSPLPHLRGVRGSHRPVVVVVVVVEVHVTDVTNVTLASKASTTVVVDTLLASTKLYKVPM